MQQIGVEIEILAASIWDAMFDESLKLTGGGEPGEGRFVTSFVAINGAWRGAVIGQFPEPLALRLTAALFESPGEPDPDEVRDALGEISNIVAGNVKALVAEPSSLSLPAVAFGSDYEVEVVGANLVATRNFTCDGEVFTISVLESADAEELKLRML